MFAENDAGRKLEWQPFTIWLEVEVNIHIFLRLHLVSPQQNIDERILKSGEVVVLILIKRYNRYQKSSPQVTSLENGQTSFTYPGTRGWYFSHNFIWSLTVNITCKRQFSGRMVIFLPFWLFAATTERSSWKKSRRCYLKGVYLKSSSFFMIIIFEIPSIPTLVWFF